MDLDPEYELIEKLGHLAVYRSRITGETLSRISSPASNPLPALSETKVKLYTVGAEAITAKQLMALRQIIPGWQTFSIEDVKKVCSSNRFYIGEFYPEHAGVLISNAASIGVKLVSA